VVGRHDYSLQLWSLWFIFFKKVVAMTEIPEKVVALVAIMKKNVVAISKLL